MITYHLFNTTTLTLVAFLYLILLGAGKTWQLLQEEEEAVALVVRKR